MGRDTTPHVRYHQMMPAVIRHKRINQSICPWCFKQFSLDELCRIAMSIGYRGIDLVGPADFPTLKKYDLIGTLTPSHSLTHGLCHRENWDICLAEIRAAITATSEVGFPNVICFSGNGNGIDRPEGLKNCAAAIHQVVGLAEKSNVTLCMELLNSKVDHRDYLCDNSAWGIELVNTVSSPRFKLVYDIYHMQIMEGNIIDTITTHHDHFAHYHTAGVPSRHEIDASQELNYSAIVKAIAATGYNGWLSQEFIPTGDALASLISAAQICDVE